MSRTNFNATNIRFLAGTAMTMALDTERLIDLPSVDRWHSHPVRQTQGRAGRRYQQRLEFRLCPDPRGFGKPVAKRRVDVVVAASAPSLRRSPTFAPAG
jgi:hypothetical protein